MTITRYKIQIRFDDRERVDMDIFADNQESALNKAYKTIPETIQKHIVMHEVFESIHNQFEPKS